ncbi:MAG TPA: hypothetical protein VFG10_18400 [Saprospiraceae bacterium]|nr:hypothetical protein [Saprospiraceae bacterium]
MDPVNEEKNQSRQTQEVYKEIDFKKESLNLLTCPRCNHILSGSDIDVEKTKAKCSHCGYTFGFAFDSSNASIIPELLIPEGIEELKLRSELDLRLRWKETTSKGGRWFMLLFASVWNLILLPVVIGVIVSGQWGIMLFLSMHLLIGMGLLWHLATIYMNSTSISVTRERIRIRTMPLMHPLWKNKDIAVRTIDQLYVSKYVQSTSNGVPNYAFALYTILKSGEKVSLIRGMNLETQVYIEKAIEDYLEIKNLKVQDEAER